LSDCSTHVGEPTPCAECRAAGWNPNGLTLAALDIEKVIPVKRRDGRYERMQAEANAIVMARQAARERQEKQDEASPLPWPSYASTPAKRIPALAVELGISPSVVAAYELQHQKRSAVLSKLVADEDDAGPIEFVVSA
jgi:hypothetical protein